MANRRQRRARRQRLRNRKIQQAGIMDGAYFINSIRDEIRPRIMDGADFINSMPDEILHHILSFIPTVLAMQTCVLSKRWRHVWCESPSLDIDDKIHKTGKIKENLISYTAPKITSFKFRIDLENSAAEVDSWLEFATSRNVQNLSVEILDNFKYFDTFDFRDFFYRSSSVKKLTVSHFYYMNPRCTVSWKSLSKLSLVRCKVGDESMENILSGCPILESLSLYGCTLLDRLDLSKSPSVRRLKINRTMKDSGPIVIVAPHIHYLSLINSDKPSTLVDVSSLTEANLDIYTGMMEASRFKTMTLYIGMLAKSRNVETLTVGPNFLKILSLADLRGAPFPTLKVQTLIIKTTTFVRSLVLGIARLLRNSPGLKKLIVGTTKQTEYMEIMDMRLERDSDPKALNRQQLWRFPTSKEMYTMLGCNDETSKLLVSFMELVLRNAKTLERMVVWLGGIYLNDDAQWFEELLRMVGTLSHDNNVSIVLKRNNYFKVKVHEPLLIWTDESYNNVLIDSP